MSRVQRKRDERVRRIVAVAAEVFGERGYEATTLEEVAERLDVTKGSLYYYFAGKDELATAAIETLGTDWTERLEALATSLAEASRPERLRALLRAHIAIAVQEYPAALRLFLVPDSWPAALRDRIRELRRRHDLVFRRELIAGVDAGEFSVVSVDATLQAMHATMSQAPLWCSHLAPEARDRAMDDLAEVLCKLAGEHSVGL